MYLDTFTRRNDLQLLPHDPLHVFQRNEDVLRLQISMDQLALLMQVLHAEQDLFGDDLHDGGWDGEIDQRGEGDVLLPRVAVTRRCNQLPVLLGELADCELVLLDPSLRE